MKACVCDRLCDEGTTTCGDYRCELHERGWGVLELRREDGGWRHYLQGEPVHCGTSLVLQAITEPWPGYLPKGFPRPAIWVRYEAALWRPEPPAAMLHASFAGHPAVIRASDATRVCWPFREQR